MTCHQPNEDLLLVIDMQNVYTDGQPWACCGVEQAADAIRRLLDAQVCGQVMFTRFLPPENPVGVWAEYNQVNAAINADPFANAMMPEFDPYLERYPLLDKSVYSSFAIPEVKQAAQRARQVVVTGVVAECCVLATALAGIDLGHRIVYLTDAVAGLSTDSQAQAQAVLSYLAPLHTRIMTTEEYMRENGR